MSYGYDAYDRFNQLSATSAGLSAAYTYGFTTNTNLIATISDTSGWTETMSYETNRDLLASIEGKYSTATKAKFAYTHDNLGRRTSVTTTKTSRAPRRSGRR